MNSKKEKMWLIFYRLFFQKAKWLAKRCKKKKKKKQYREGEIEMIALSIHRVSKSGRGGGGKIPETNYYPKKL